MVKICTDSVENGKAFLETIDEQVSGGTGAGLAEWLAGWLSGGTGVERAEVAIVVVVVLTRKVLRRSPPII